MKEKTILILLLMSFLISCNSSKKESGTMQEATFKIEKGLNVSHWLSQSDLRGAERQAYMTEADFRKITELGFDHVRIPIDEVQMWDENGNKHEDAFTLLHNAIKWSFDNDLRVIVDLHIIRSHYFNAKDNTLWTDPAEQEKFWGFWVQLSEELIEYPNSKLAYELMNEAVADDPEDWNKLIAKGIEVVRKNEPERKIVVGSNKWQQVYTFPDLKIPENDTNLILSFHDYEPFLFTHYKTPWNPVYVQYEGPVHYPGYTIDTAEYANLQGPLLEKVKNDNGYFDKEILEKNIMIAVRIAKEYGLPLYCGEFGCFPSTPMEDRVRLYTDLMDIFKRNNISWTHWNYKNDFPVVDEKTLEPIEEIVTVLIGN